MFSTRPSAPSLSSRPRLTRVSSRQVREEDRVELVVSGLDAGHDVDVGAVPKLVGRLELHIDVEFDPSPGRALG